MQAVKTCQASRVQNLPAHSVPAFLVESKKYEKVLSFLFSSETLSYSFSSWESRGIIHTEIRGVPASWGRW